MRRAISPEQERRSADQSLASDDADLYLLVEGMRRDRADPLG